jgi:hypothetical protein
MLVMSGDKERTETEFGRLFKVSGFVLQESFLPWRP